jgi:plasmid maintenance system antidote protein VapI
LYREASCFDGCDGGDHIPRRIAARISSTALAAYRLSTRGYYDESLSLTRSIGEAANLLFLFSFMPNEYELWKSSDERLRRDRYRPVRVREMIQRAGLPVPIDRERYGLLSSIVVHLGPEVTPQAHLPKSRGSLGALHRDEGVMVAINELAGAVGVAAASIARFLPERCRLTLKRDALELLDSIGGMNLVSVRAIVTWSDSDNKGRATDD